MQTEVIEMCTKWTQYPPDDFKGCGEGDGSQERNDLQENVFTPHSIDSVRLTNFLQQAGQVCLILLEEKISARKDLMFKERNDLDISDGFIQLATKLPFLEGRRVLDMKFNSVQTHLLLTAHDCSNVETSVDKNDCLQERGIVCYWNVNEPSQPQKILYCESSPKSCCFSSVKSSLVFAGLEDGSVVVWDVRESSSLHSTINNKDNQWVVRRPTFSTAGVLFSENHLSPVQNILPIALPIDSAQALSRSTVLQDEPGGMAFQLASLDESGVVNIWVVIELDKPDEAGSENDLGLAPGGRVKLIKSTSIQVESPHREMFVGSAIQTSTMQFSTLDPNHFYVGTDRGWVVHCTRYGGRAHPKVYRPETESFVTITAIDVSPWNIPVMLVGCTDGTLRLHDLRKEHAIRSWPETTQGSAIVQLMWSKSRPSLFFVLDAKSNLYIWDLLQKDGHPVATESFKRGKLLYFSMSNDYESLGVGLRGRKSELALNYEGEIIELHRLKENLTNVQADELDRFASLVDSII
ncbi:WD repeat-containing 60-like [Paramuricea clavata]|uniref:WD repeat-containing 60-like n=2 Tax=Paramuricea clavata TaxID=317549 RepID=A0A6S7GHZ8_PARCT|nr:WD repeat-containing 60-like [Paramuricea clavata]